jgi:DNA-binding HxlR family transcriptional regulator
MLKRFFDDYSQAKECPFRNVLDRVGDKWSFLIFAVLEDGPKRFNEINRLPHAARSCAAWTRIH